MLEKLTSYLSQFTLGKLLPALFVAAIGFLLVQLILKILKTTLSKTKLDPQLVKLLLGVLKPVLSVVLGLIVATSLGINVTSIVALASVLTLAISLSLQNALTNLIGGFTLLHTKPFIVEDYVEIAGQSGTVKEVGLSYTKLATSDNKIVSIPNAAVVAAEIVNYSTTGTRRLDITVNTSYSAQPEAVIAALLASANIPEVLQNPAPFSALSGYGEGNVSYVLQVWTTSGNYWAAKFAILKNIKEIFAEKDIEMSCSHMNIHVIP